MNITQFYPTFQDFSKSIKEDFLEGTYTSFEGYIVTFGPTIQVTYEGPGFFHQKLAKRLSFTSPEWASLIHLTQTKLIGPVYDA